MSHSTLLPLVIAAWIAVGPALGLFMGRRGHNAFGWLVIGSLLGPMAIPVAIAGARSEPRHADEVLASAVPGHGDVDVLVGLDGSTESVAALHAALAILGPRIRRLSLAGVVDFDVGASESPALGEPELCAELSLQEAYVLSMRPALELAVADDLALRPEVAILRGKPARALLQKATEDGFDLIVVGTRGRSVTRALLGSVAIELTSQSKVPVLLAGADGGVVG